MKRSTDRLIKDRLIPILERFAVYEKPANEDTRLFHDMGIYGDDVDELFEILHKEFDTDFSNFDFQAYFPNETDYLCPYLARLMKTDFSKFEPIRIGDLISAIERERW